MEIKVKFGQDAGKVLVSEKGTFSLYLPEGSYDVTVEVKASDSLASRGIGFAPVKQVVAVTDSPVADINFQPISEVFPDRGHVLVENITFNPKFNKKVFKSKKYPIEYFQVM